MNSQSILDSYSRKNPWLKVIGAFRSAAGLTSGPESDESLDVESLISNLTGLDMGKSLSIAGHHKTSVIHLTDALIEAGVDQSLLSKKKVQLLSFVLNTLGFVKFDKVIEEVIHEGKFLNLSDALKATDENFVNLVFSVLKTIFPPLGALEMVLKGVLNKV